jgi:hypothetical protein
LNSNYKIFINIEMFSTGGTRFGGGMRFNVQNISNKPPSRATSKRKPRNTVKRADSANRLMKEDRTNNTRGIGGASLSRTQGKRASRIIFSDKTETNKETKPTRPDSYVPSHMPTSVYTNNIINTSSNKPGISTYMDKITKPSPTAFVSSNNIFGSSSSTSNFPKKIAIPRDSIDESTRDETKSSSTFKTESLSKPIRTNYALNSTKVYSLSIIISNTFAKTRKLAICKIRCIYKPC